MKKISVIILTVLVFVMSMSFSFASETETDDIPDGVIAVSDAEGLTKISENLSADYVITADITFDEKSTWEPIGTPENPFTGTIDGGDCIISGLKVTITDDSEGDICAGLFGVTNGATIKNIRMKATRISVTESEDSSDWSAIYAGAVVGYAYDTKITNCFNTGNILTSSSKSMCVSGGIAGCADNGSSVTTSFNSGKVFSSSKDNLSLSGGICGELKSSSVTNCYNSGTVSSTAIKESFAYAGGIAGEASADGVDEKAIVNTDLSYILTSYNSGNITALKHSDATENIDGNEGKFSAYGILASSLHSKVENCYSIDSVPACVGYSVSETETKTDQSEETAVNKILTSDEMMDFGSFTGFSEEVWTINECEGYPYPTLRALPHDSVKIENIEVTEPESITCMEDRQITIVGGLLLVKYDDGETEEVDFDNEDVIMESYDFPFLKEQTFSGNYKNYPFSFESKINHDLDYDNPEVEDATCETGGYIAHKCKVCHEIFTEETEMLEHSLYVVSDIANACYVEKCENCSHSRNFEPDETRQHIEELIDEYYLKDYIYTDKLAVMDISHMCVVNEFTDAHISNYAKLEIMVASYSLYGMGDVDFDGIIRAKDLSMMLYYYDRVEGCVADISEDGKVNSDDLSTLLDNYGKRLSQLLK